MYIPITFAVWLTLCVPCSLPSGTQVLSWGVGDSFDFAQLLASYLLGAGYDAYVVYGTAPVHVCNRDQTNVEWVGAGKEAKVDADEGESKAEVKEEANPLAEEKKTLDEDAPEDENEEEEETAPRKAYEVKEGGVPDSEFLTRFSNMDQAEAKDSPDDNKKPKIVSPLVNWESDEEKEGGVHALKDPLAGRRMHAWVLIRGGKRDETAMQFVEPSTGKLYPVGESPYEKIEGVWNAKNFWVNMQVSTTNT